jgi:hypothetical protein
VSTEPAAEWLDDDACIARTNYFRVKDRDAFIAVLAPVAIDIIFAPQDADLLCLVARGTQGWPYDYRDEYGLYANFDLFSTLATHLADGQVAISMEVGGARSRYAFGIAWAVNNLGKQRLVDLAHEILQKAEELGPDVGALWESML